MDPTALPTDNLYKFAALSGIALVAFLLWLTWKIQQKLLADLLTITVKEAKSDAVVNRLADLDAMAKLKKDDWDDRFAKLTAATTAGKNVTVELQELDAEARTLQSDNTALFKERHQSLEAQGKLLAVVRALNLQQRVVEKQKRLYVIATFVALAWSIAGFSLWYYKLQMPLDAKLKLEAEVTTVELQIKKAALEASRPVDPGSPTGQKR